jgi:hypothetical protein
LYAVNIRRGIHGRLIKKGRGISPPENLEGKVLVTERNLLKVWSIESAEDGLDFSRDKYRTYVEHMSNLWSRRLLLSTTREVVWEIRWEVS